MIKTQKLKVYLHHQQQKLLVGTCLHVDHDIYFEYHPDFIKSEMQLSPFKLPLKSGAYKDQDRVFDGLPGLLYDSLPDGWGLLLMDRYFRQEGIEPRQVTPLERLAFIGDRALGALSYEPSLDIQHQWGSDIGLELLAKHCEIVLHGNDNHVLSELIIAGGSPGGARPKVIVGFNKSQEKLCSGVANLPKGYQHFLIKFPAMTDVNDNAQVEYAYSLMAKDCDITMPPTKLFDAGSYGAAFGIERFDRIKNQRVHMQTLSGLLHANFRIPNLDYIDFLKATWLLTQDQQQVLQGYRRMMFNIFTHNRDDHSKNFSFVYRDLQWQLSPAYDLTFSSGMASQHTMTIAGEGANPNKTHVFEVANKLNIQTNTATKIIKQIQEVTNDWRSYAKRAGVDKPISNRLSKVFDNITM